MQQNATVSHIHISNHEKRNCIHVHWKEESEEGRKGRGKKKFL